MYLIVKIKKGMVELLIKEGFDTIGEAMQAYRQNFTEPINEVVFVEIKPVSIKPSWFFRIVGGEREHIFLRLKPIFVETT